MKYKVGDKIFVFDGSNYGEMDYWIDRGVYEITDVVKFEGETTIVEVEATMNSDTHGDTAGYCFCLPENQVMHLGTNKLIEILFDTESYL